MEPLRDRSGEAITRSYFGPLRGGLQWSRCVIAAERFVDACLSDVARRASMEPLRDRSGENCPSRARARDGCELQWSRCVIAAERATRAPRPRLATIRFNGAAA